MALHVAGGALTKVGKESVGASTGSSTTRRAQVHTMTEAGTIYSVSVYGTTATGQIHAAIYDDDANTAGFPGTRLAQSADTNFTAENDFQEVPLTSSVSLSNGDAFWFAWVVSANIGHKYGTASPGRVIPNADNEWLSLTPDPYGAATQGTTQFTAYASYRPAAAVTCGTAAASGAVTVTSEVTATAEVACVSTVASGAVAVSKTATAAVACMATVVSGAAEVTKTATAAVTCGSTAASGTATINQIIATIVIPDVTVSGTASVLTTVIAGGEPGTIGWSSIGSTTATTGTTTRRANKYAMTEDGLIYKVNVYGANATGLIRVAVYDDDGSTAGFPGTRLAYSNNQVVTGDEDWNEVRLVAPVTVASGESVWLSWVTSADIGQRYDYSTNGRVVPNTNSTWIYGTPDPFGAATQANSRYSAYADYFPAAAATTPNVSVSGTVTVTDPTVKTATWHSPTGDATTLGTATIGDSWGALNYRRAIPVTATEGGLVSTVSYYHTADATSVLIGIYSDSSSAPGTLITSTATETVDATQEWSTFDLETPFYLATGVTVWIAIIAEYTASIAFAAGSPGAVTATGDDRDWDAGMPTTFGTSQAVAANLSLYLTYTPCTITAIGVPTVAGTAERIITNDSAPAITLTAPTVSGTASRSFTTTSQAAVMPSVAASGTAERVTRLKFASHLGTQPIRILDGAAFRFDGCLCTARPTSQYGGTWRLLSATVSGATAPAVSGIATASAATERVVTAVGAATASITFAASGTATYEETSRRYFATWQGTKVSALVDGVMVRFDGLLSTSRPIAQSASIWRALGQTVGGATGISFSAATASGTAERTVTAECSGITLSAPAASGYAERQSQTSTPEVTLTAPTASGTVTRHIYGVGDGTGKLGQQSTSLAGYITSDIRYATSWTTTRGCVIKSLSFYGLTTTTGQCQLGIYSDSGGLPNLRLARTAKTTVVQSGSNAWHTFQLQQRITVAKGVKLWFAIVSQPGFNVAYRAGVPGHHQATTANTFADGMPAAFGATYNYVDTHPILYANYDNGVAVSQSAIITPAGTVERTVTASAAAAITISTVASGRGQLAIYATAGYQPIQIIDGAVARSGGLYAAFAPNTAYGSIWRRLGLTAAVGARMAVPTAAATSERYVVSETPAATVGAPVASGSAHRDWTTSSQAATVSAPVAAGTAERTVTATGAVVVTSPATVDATPGRTVNCTGAAVAPSATASGNAGKLVSGTGEVVIGGLATAASSVTRNWTANGTYTESVRIVDGAPWRFAGQFQTDTVSSNYGSTYRTLGFTYTAWITSSSTSASALLIPGDYAIGAVEVSVPAVSGSAIIYISAEAAIGMPSTAASGTVERTVTASAEAICAAVVASATVERNVTSLGAATIAVPAISGTVTLIRNNAVSGAMHVNARCRKTWTVTSRAYAKL